MGMVRMFHVACDVCFERVDSDEWYASLAERRALDEGYVKRGKRWLCPECAADAAEMAERMAIQADAENERDGYRD